MNGETASDGAVLDAPAKINLYLHVTGRRPDGYHLLESLVAFTGTGDRLSAAPSEALTLSVSGPFAGALEDDDADNLVLRAAHALRDASGTHAGAALHLKKNLPVASGIGGGSADAAAALRLLRHLWEIPADGVDLAALAAGLGADVPVCLAGTPCVMTGIGDELAPQPPLPPCGVVLVNAGEAVPTPDVFRARSGPFTPPGHWQPPADADALFAEATDAVLDGFERPLVSLSGGYDSQAVAAYAMRARRHAPLLSATSVPQAGWCPPSRSRAWVDERPHVRALAGMYPQLQPHWVDGEGRDFSYFLRDLFDAALAPPRNVGNLHWVHDVRQTAQREGADVILTGALGNLTFSYDGLGYLPDLLRAGQLRLLGRELWRGGPRRKVAKRLFRQAILPLLPRAVQKSVLEWRDGPLDHPLESWSPLRSDYALASGVLERACDQGADPFFLPVSSVRQFRTNVLGHAMNEAGDITGAIERIHGIPMRDPTRYRPLLEFCFAIPVRQYLNAGTKRWLAKRMLTGKVPEMVLQETRRARQAADWSARIRPARAALMDELDMLAGDPDVAARIDTARLRRRLASLPESDSELTMKDTLAFEALARGMVTARFIGYLKGRNDI